MEKFTQKFFITNTFPEFALNFEVTVFYNSSSALGYGLWSRHTLLMVLSLMQIIWLYSL